jgi:hypothetical protein
LSRRVVASYLFCRRTGGDIDAAYFEQLFLSGFRLVLFFCICLATAEKLKTQGDIIFAVSVCQQPEVPYPNKAIRQHMEKESPDELIYLQRHHLLLITIGAVTPH